MSPLLAFVCSKDCGDWRMSEEVRLVANTSASGSWAEILVARERAISVASRVRILGEFMVSSRVVVSVGSDLSDAARVSGICVAPCVQSCSFYTHAT